MNARRVALLAFLSLALAFPAAARPPHPDAGTTPAGWVPVSTRVARPGVHRLGPVRLRDLPAYVPRAGERPVLIPNVFPGSAEIPGDRPGRREASGTSEAANQRLVLVQPERPTTPTTLDEGTLPAIDVRFDGPYDGGVAPPDPVMAPGSRHVVVLVNLVMAVYDKQGTRLSGPTSLRTFFGIPAGFNIFDPVAVPDPFRDRLVVGVAARKAADEDSRIYLAFSDSNDATGTWHRFWIDADAGQPGNWADYPAIGLDRLAVYVTANMFSSSNSYRNASLFIVDKEAGYAGETPDVTTMIDVRTSGGGSPYRLRPAYVPAATPGDAYFLVYGNNAFANSFEVFRLTGDRFANPSLTARSVALPGNYFAPGDADQPGDTGVPTLGANPWNVFWRDDGTLWTAQAISGSQVTVWVHEFDVSGETPTRVRTWELSIPGKDSFFPHVIPDTEDDDFALMTAFCAEDTFVTGRYWNVGADGTVRAAELLVDGTRVNGSDRHGDYFAMYPDPSDRNRLWMIAQYMKNSSFSGNSIVASALFEEAAPPASPPPVPDGKDVSGEEIRVRKNGDGTVTITWDASTCPAPGNHLAWYDLAAIASYQVTSETCAIGTSGSWTGNAPAGNVGVIVVSDDDATVEGSHGVDSSGNERPSVSSSCGFTSKDTTGTCAP